MTREQKLALIVGFSLILFVGVLISDHLSGARRARIAKVEPEAAPAPLTVAPIPAPGPAPETHAVAPARADDPLQLIGGGSRPPDPAPAAPANQIASTSPTPQPETPAAHDGARPVGDSNRFTDSALADEVRRAEGQLVRGPDGTWNIQLPRAAQLTPTPPPQSPIPTLIDSRTPAPVNTRVGPMEALKTHVVSSGETLFQITNRYYGNGNLWRELARFNGMDKAGTLRLGAQIKLPPRETLLGRSVANGLEQSTDPAIKLIRPAPAKPEAPRAAPVPQRGKAKIELASYTVRKGDTLGDISFKTLGTSRRWQEIAELNSLDDEDAITTGAVLKIPAKRS